MLPHVRYQVCGGGSASHALCYTSGLLRYYGAALGSFLDVTWVFGS